MLDIVSNPMFERLLKRDFLNDEDPFEKRKRRKSEGNTINSFFIFILLFYLFIYFYFENKDCRRE